MRHRFGTFCVVGLLTAAAFGGLSHCWGQENAAYPPARLKAVPEPSVQLIHRADDKPVLKVTYPWDRHPDVTLEVVWLPNDCDDARIVPLRFGAKHLKGGRLLDFQRAMDRAQVLDNSQRLQIDGTTYQLRAFRNALGRPALTVSSQVAPDSGSRGTRVAYFWLDRWAQDGNTLWLDLPDREFCQAGQVYVWLLRGPEVLWSETVCCRRPQRLIPERADTSRHVAGDDRRE